MTLMRLIPICTATLLSLSAAAGQDAAQEVQEGNVQRWMEYYERERGRLEPRDVIKETTSQSGQPSGENKAQPAGAAIPDSAATRPPERE